MTIGLRGGRSNAKATTALAAAYGGKADVARAVAARSELEKLEPGFSIEVLKSRRYSDRPAYQQQAERHLYPGLRKAGVAER